MEKIKSIFFKILIVLAVTLIVPLLLLLGVIYFITKGIKTIWLRKRGI